MVYAGFQYFSTDLAKTKSPIKTINLTSTASSNICSLGYDVKIRFGKNLSNLDIELSITIRFITLELRLNMTNMNGAEQPNTPRLSLHLILSFI